MDKGLHEYLGKTVSIKTKNGETIEGFARGWSYDGATEEQYDCLDILIDGELFGVTEDEIEEIKVIDKEK